MIYDTLLKHKSLRLMSIYTNKYNDHKQDRKLQDINSKHSYNSY